MTTTRRTVSLNGSQLGMSGPGLPGAKGCGSLPISATSRTRIGKINQNRFCAICLQRQLPATSSPGVSERMAGLADREE
jgi:hypothetical protein